MKNVIPFSKHAKLGNDARYVMSVIENNQVSGAQPVSRKVENLLKKNVHPLAKILLTPSCTHALEITSILLNLKPGDEVIVPSYTFVSTALAFYMHGAKPRFCDVKKEDFNIDEEKIEDLVNEKTKAIRSAPDSTILRILSGHRFNTDTLK